jgi:hypothetical protein
LRADSDGGLDVGSDVGLEANAAHREARATSGGGSV